MAHTSAAPPTVEGYEYSVRIDLHGRAFPERDSPSKVYQPHYQKYSSPIAADVVSDDFVPHAAVEYKDVITTWKGLTPAQAKELFFWENVFKRCFQDRVEHTLIRQFKASNDQLKRLPITTLLSHMYDFVMRLGPQRMTIDLEALIDDMVRIFMKQGSHHTWFSSSGSIRTAIANFLMSRDCFLGTHPFPLGVVDAMFSAGYASEQQLIITCDVAWVPPRMVFVDVETQAEEKQDYYLLPRFAARLVLGEYETYQLVSQHNVTSDDMGFAWEDGLEGFHGITPPLYELAMRSSGANNPLKGMTCRFETESIVTQHFPGGVRLERVLRNRISLQVMPSSKPSTAAMQSSNPIARFVQQQTLPVDNQRPFHTPRSVPVRTRRKAVNPEPFETPLALRVRSRKDILREAPMTEPRRLREGIQANPRAKALEQNGPENKALTRDSLIQNPQQQSLRATEPASTVAIQVNPWLETTPTRRSSKPGAQETKLGDAPEEHAGPSTGSDVPEPLLKTWNKNLPAWRLMSGLDQFIDHDEPSAAHCQSHFSDCSTSTKVPNSHSGMSDDGLLLGRPHTPTMASRTSMSMSHIDLPSPIDEVGFGKRFPPLREMLRGGSGSFAEMQTMHALRTDMLPSGHNPSRSPKASSTADKHVGALVFSLLQEHLARVNTNAEAASCSVEDVPPRVFRGLFQDLGRESTSSPKLGSPSVLPQIQTLRELSGNTPNRHQASEEPPVTGKGKRAANSSFDVDSDTHESIAPPTRRTRRDSMFWDSADEDALPSSPKESPRKPSDSTTWERIKQFVLQDLESSGTDGSSDESIARMRGSSSRGSQLVGESEGSSSKKILVHQRLECLAKLLEGKVDASHEVREQTQTAIAVQANADVFQHQVQDYYSTLIASLEELQKLPSPRKRSSSDEMAFEAVFLDDDEDNDVDMTDSSSAAHTIEPVEEPEVEKTY